ncbi:hypothetical protein GV054_16810 [Marinomonas mediterranea]|uniref:hypothetical protein n=1 Tax=Marinomonas mediterranea TaxID=119864 RepID=UPI00234BAADA|nr:hypothetical protein [Marinomonas mediterranea]WCN14543.1 hypothetical protein GV054_16810 [Marinomonas mediterranea]
MPKTQSTLGNSLGVHYFYAFITFVVVMMLPFEDGWQHHWRLSSAAFFSEPWRLISAHFTHLNYMHAFTNCIGMVCIFVVSHKQVSLKSWSVISVYLIALIDCSLYLRSDNWFYSGSSSLVIGWCSFGVLVVSQYSRLIKAVTLICLGVTLLFTKTPDYLIQYSGATTQHWVAFTGGILGAIVLLAIRHWNAKHVKIA